MRTLGLLLLLSCLLHGVLHRAALWGADEPLAEPLEVVLHEPDGAPHYSFLRYRPAGQPPAGGWPLVLSLHGFSLRGDDPARVAEYGLPRAIADGLRPPMLVVAPQLRGWSWKDDELDAFLRWVVEHHPVDGRRIYGTGVSLGGAGLWNFVQRRPGWLAAFAPVAGTADADTGMACRATPVWAFHGTADTQVPITRPRETIAAHFAMGGDGRLTEFAEGPHDAFTREVFVDHDLLGWFATRTRVEPAPPPPRRDPREALPEPVPTSRWQGPLELPPQATVLSWIDALSAHPHRRPGSDHGRAAEDWIVDRLEASGLSPQVDVVPVNRWEPATWSLRIDGVPIRSHPVMYTTFTGAAGLRAPLVAVGRGTAAEFAGKDIAGSVVVIDAVISSRTTINPARALFAQDPAGRFAQPVWHVAYPSNYLSDFADNALLRGLNAVTRAIDAGAVGFVMILDGHAPAVASLGWPYDGLLERIPGWYVAAADGERLRAAAVMGRNAELRSEGLVGRGEMRTISAIVPGRSPRAVIVASHHDAPGPGVIEDATGTAAVLALADAWARVPAEQRPSTVAFVLACGHFVRGEGAWRWAMERPRLIGSCRAILELEHLAGREVTTDAEGHYVVLPTRQPSTLYVSGHPEMAQIARQALEAEPQPPVTVERPALGLLLTDAAGYVVSARDGGLGGRAGPAYISWISTPPYLVDEHDTRDKLDPAQYASALRAASELLRRLVALPEGFNRTRTVALGDHTGWLWQCDPSHGVIDDDGITTRYDGLEAARSYRFTLAPAAVAEVPR